MPIIPVGGGGTGTPGKSAYEVAVDNGFVGTEFEWLESLVGFDGEQGPPGNNGYTPIKGVDYFDGEQGIQGPPGTTEWSGIDNKPSVFPPDTHSHAYEPANANIQTHVLSAHAPSTAQKNSDILKAEIEAKLTGEISTHTHAGGQGGATYFFLMDI